MFGIVHVVSLYLVTASIRLKIREAKIGTSNSKWFDLTSLKDQGVREEFNITLRNRYNTLQDETAFTIDQFHQVMIDAATEVIGYKRPIKLESLSKNTWNVIEERKQIKLVEAKSLNWTKRQLPCIEKKVRKWRSQQGEISAFTRTNLPRKHRKPLK